MPPPAPELRATPALPVGASYDEYDAKASKDAKERSATAKRVPKALRQVLDDVTKALGN